MPCGAAVSADNPIDQKMPIDDWPGQVFTFLLTPADADQNQVIMGMKFA